MDLGCNQISSLESLVRKPLQNLEHLGLAYNHLYDAKDYFHPSFWLVFFLLTVEFVEMRYAEKQGIYD